jgi:hypothetical protein
MQLRYGVISGGARAAQVHGALHQSLIEQKQQQHQKQKKVVQKLGLGDERDFGRGI